MTTNEKVQTVLAVLATRNSLSKVKSKDLYAVSKFFGLTGKLAKELILDKATMVKRGVYDVSLLTDGSVSPLNECPPAVANILNGDTPKPVKRVPVETPAETPAPQQKLDLALSSINSTEVHIPAKDPNYVPWGQFSMLKKIIASEKFMPIYISGFSGNGKTIMVTQACAAAKRKYVRVQIGPETDEDALLGGFRLIDGETVFNKGPVVEAMEQGAVLLIDEIDRGDNKIMCLQSVLEGNPVLISKTGELVVPSPGFNVIATANTKGAGADSDYSAAQVIDEAFLERFVGNVEQAAPTMAIETRIVEKALTANGIEDAEFAQNLAAWSSVIHKTYSNGGIDTVVSTRRLCHIARTYSILEDKMASINLCLARFDTETKEAFLDLYTKVDAGVDATSINIA